jgi:tRNA(Ile)-lysidine synthase
VRDPTNRKRAYLRNRVRLDVLARLGRSRGAVERALARSAANLRADQAVLERVTEEALAGCQQSQDLVSQAAPPPTAGLQRHDSGPGSGGLLLYVERLAALPEPLRARVLLRAVGRASGRVPTRRQVCALLDLVSSRAGSRRLDLAGLAAVREYGLLRLCARPKGAAGGAPSQPAEVVVTRPGRYEFGAHVVEITFSGPAAARGLVLRAPRPGDRLRPRGMAGRSRKLSDLFVDAKVPRADRACWPVLAARARDGAPAEILAVPGLRSAHGSPVVASLVR